MRLRKILCLISVLAMAAFSFAGCSSQKSKTAKSSVDFSGISSICELATLKCYYHNVAKSETEPTGFWGKFGIGYKKLWTEYSGIVNYGIRVDKLVIGQPDENGVIRITVPDAEVLDTDFDIDSISEPLTDTGFLTKITKEEETAALAAAQSDMEKTAKANTAVLRQAKERAKTLIEEYVQNIGVVVGEDYRVEWVDAEE